MLLRTPMGFWLVVFALGLLAGAAPAAAQTSPRAGDTPTPAPAYKPDARFLRDEPFRKTKQLVQLTGVKSEAELATVRGAINDVVGFVRLFGITGSNVGSAVV
ncbi:MAG: hypothetical protein EBR46_05185, partial [Betaproteobacteria bacterium]|nr:hypothetical protein [Betaproteobacteria bacterium]